MLFKKGKKYKHLINYGAFYNKVHFSWFLCPFLSYWVHLTKEKKKLCQKMIITRTKFGGVGGGK